MYKISPIWIEYICILNSDSTILYFVLQQDALISFVKSVLFTRLSEGLIKDRLHSHPRRVGEVREESEVALCWSTVVTLSSYLPITGFLTEPPPTVLQ